MGILAGGLTDVGKKRSSNQDSIYLSNKIYLYVVADGMGGHSGGDIASKMATTLLPEFIIKGMGQCKTEADMAKLLVDGFKHTNKSILEYSNQHAQLKGMGTTMVALMFFQTTLFVCNVGDSRAYLVHEGEIYQLSRDHSLIQEKINLGLYTREEGLQDKMKNVLSRTVGFEPDMEADLFHFKVHRGDAFLLCSDGLHGKVADQDIIEIFNAHLPTNMAPNKENLDLTCRTLVDLANQNGGPDNISVIVVKAI